MVEGFIAGAASLVVWLAAAVVAILLAVFPFGVAPPSIQRLFFDENERWRPRARAAWVTLMAGAIALALLAVRPFVD